MALDLLIKNGPVADGSGLPLYRADVVIFDEARIKPQLPTVEHDLPGGARRLVQKADGIAATILGGAVAVENGAATGPAARIVLKGRLAA